MKFKIALLSVVMVMAVGCGSGGLGGIDLGSILGSTGASDTSDVRGVVSSVDTRNQVINLDVNQVNNLRENQQGQSIYYDSNTVVEYQGQQYRVENLERGDEISIRGANRDGRFVAERVTVERDVTR
jgi:hypothetical protein